MWVNILIRTLATVALFDFLQLPLGEGALIFGMVYNYLLFMIYPIYNTLQKKWTRAIEEAAQTWVQLPGRFFKNHPTTFHAGVADGISDGIQSPPYQHLLSPNC